MDAETVPFGAAVLYRGATPTRPATFQYTYTFAGWDHALDSVKTDFETTAQYATNRTPYTITFLNYDGTVISHDLWGYGTTPSCAKTPVRESNDTTDFTFSGWSPEIIPVTAEASYTAQYSESVRTYTITFQNDDGTILQQDKLVYGETPVYQGTIPTKLKSDQFTYGFHEWVPSITPVKAEATYTASYSETLNQYTVRFLNEDGSELQSSLWNYGTTPFYSGSTPVKTPAPGYIETFKEFVPALAPVSGATTYQATYTVTPDTSFFEFTYDDTTLSYTVSKSLKATTGAAIPEAYDDGTHGTHPVTAIGTLHFSNPSELVTIVLPSTIKTIESQAFSRCTALCDFVFPSSLEEIGQSAFEGCSSLTTFKAPAALKSLGVRAFADCTLLKNVDFRDCAAPLPNWIFSGCTSLSEFLYSPSLTNIPDDAFYHCSALSSFSFQEGLVSIGAGAFYKVPFTSIAFPKSLKTIGAQAFEENTVLTSISFSEGLESIGLRAFYSDYRLQELNFPSTLKTIGAYAFRGCLRLLSVYIPSSVLTVGKEAFQTGASGLALCEATSKPSGWDDTWNEPDSNKAKALAVTWGILDRGAWDEDCLYVATATEAYVAMIAPGTTALSVNATFEGKPVTTILDYAGAHSPDLETITLPESVTVISNYAFTGCTILQKIPFLGQLQKIGDYAFSGTGIDGDLIFPSTLTEIGEYAFYNDTKITGASFPTSFPNIPAGIFGDCTALKTLTWPRQVLSIGKEAFVRCPLEETLTLGFPNVVIGSEAFGGSSVRTTLTFTAAPASIGMWAFSDCRFLTEVNLPEGLVAIPDYCFTRCKNLPSIVIPSTVKSIGKEAFSFGNSLKHISLPAGLESIGDNIFENSYLLEITLPEKIVSIPQEAFLGCVKLEEIHFLGPIKSIGTDAFLFCHCLKSIAIPASCISIGSGTFIQSGLTSFTLPQSVTSLGENCFEKSSCLVTFTFLGTMAEWQAANFPTSIFTGTGVTAIICSDGTLPLS